MRQKIIFGLLGCVVAFPLYAICSFNQIPTITFACAPTAVSGCTTSGNLQVMCTAAATVNITLSTGGSSSYSPRTMTDGVQGLSMNYNIYLDANHSRIFGDGSQGTYSTGGTIGVNETVAYVLYGMVLSSTVSAGSYTDSLVITMNY